MILSSSFIDCLFYIFLVGYHFDITNGSQHTNTDTTHQTNSTSTQSTTTTTTEPTTTTTTTTTTSTNIGVDGSGAASTTKLTASTSIILSQAPVTLSNGSRVMINSTIVTTHTKSSLPLILGLVFGGLAVVVLVASIVIYILMKQGYIKMFNSPRTRIMKDNDRSRLGDSSSSIGAGSPSRR